MKNYFVYPKHNEALVNGVEISVYYDNNINNTYKHSHEFYEVYLLCGGNLTFTIDNKQTNLTDKTLIIIPPTVSHSMQLATNTTYYSRVVLWISSETINRLLCEQPQYSQSLATPYITTVTSQQFDTIQHYFALIDSEQLDLLENIRQASDHYMYALINGLVEQLHRIRNCEQSQQNYLSQRIKQYIQANIAQPVSLDQLSNDMFVSKYHLMRIFKEQTGRTVHQYITLLRLAHAKKLISEGISCVVACGASGYVDYSTFYKAFTKQYQISPHNFAKSFHMATVGTN